MVIVDFSYQISRIIEVSYLFLVFTYNTRTYEYIHFCSLEKDNPEEKDTIRNERSKNNNTEEPVYQDKSPQPTKVTPRIVEPFPVIKDAARELADNDPSSDDQYISTSLSSTFPTDADQKSKNPVNSNEELYVTFLLV